MKERDPIEKFMDTDVEEMMASELVTYMRKYHAAFGFDMPVHEHASRKTMQAFKDRYPNGKAGKIVQHAMLVLGGVKDGERITPAQFAKSMTWWTDKLWLAVQEREKTEADWDASREEVESGWKSSSDLLK